MKSDSRETLLVSERFVSLQGEGPSAGQPATFLRLARCNLACSWCDTAYSWDFERFSFEEEVSEQTVLEVGRWVARAEPPRLVITGGEPLIQQKRLISLLAVIEAERVAGSVVVEVETNGTIPPHPSLLERVDQWNVSPKLAGSGESRKKRIALSVLESFAKARNAYFKFVVADEADRAEAARLCAALGVENDRILYMAEARTRVELVDRSKIVARWAVDDQVGLSPRLHLSLFDGRRGT